MEGERRESDTRVTLPEELVGRILSMVPFPQIFKIRVLSKAWQARLSPISSQDDEKEVYLATWFQEQVGESSSKWKTIYPCYISRRDFTLNSNSWKSLSLLSFLPKHLFRLQQSRWLMEGSLLLVRNVMKKNASFTRDLYVANILTRSWKRLPPQPHQKSTFQMLIYTKPTYKVIDFEEDWASKHFFAHIYDSYLDAWSSIEVSKSSDFTSSLSSWVHLDGVLYRVIGPSCLMARGLHAFSVKEGTSEMLQMSSSIHTPAQGVKLGVCNGSLFMLVYNTPTLFGNPISVIVTIVKIDLGTQRWLEVARGPPAAFRFGRFNTESVIGRDCVVFSGEDVGSLGLPYDMQNDEWSHVPSAVDFRQIDDARANTSQHIFRFQPGLNPFVKV